MRRAVYPGSFDPPTLGHVDVVERASRLFDELVVAIGVNTDKEPFLATDDRLCLLKECCAPMANVRVATFQGLLVDFAREQGCQVIVRGLRAVSDFEYEFRVAMANRRMAPEVETLFLVTKEEYSFLSSTVVREVARLGGDARKFVPSNVADRIEALPRPLRG
jgi:pantetheine-phosphate adenylyltransferase